MEYNARFYFMNLAVDVGRCARAALARNEKRYQSSLALARRTLECLRNVKRPAAYEEGLLMLLGLTLAREEGT